MHRIGWTGLLALLAASTLWAQGGPIGDLDPGRDPLPPGHGGLDPGPIIDLGVDPVAGDLGLLGRPDLDSVLGAGLVNRLDGLDRGLLNPGGGARIGEIPLVDPAAGLIVSSGLSEATEELLGGNGMDGALIDPAELPNDPSHRVAHSGSARPEPFGGPDPGSLRIDPWWQGGLPNPAGGRLVVGGPDPGQGGGDPPQGAPNVPLVPLPNPPLALRRDRGDDHPPNARLALADLQVLINQAAADVVSSRVARIVDPNSRRNEGLSVEDRRRRGRIGLALLDLLDGLTVPPADAQFLRDNLPEALSLLADARREPGTDGSALQQAVDRSACAIVDTIREGIQQ